MAEVLNPFGPSSLLFDLHLRDLLCPAQGKNLPLSWIMPFESGEHSLFIFMWIWMSMDFSWPLRLYYGRILFVTKPTLTTYLTRYFPAHSFIIHENLTVNARIFLGTLRVYILDLVYNFIDHPYHSANPVLNVNLHILWETLSVLSECGTTWLVLSPEQFHPFLWQGYCEYLTLFPR